MSVVGRITTAGAWDTTFGEAGGGGKGYSGLTLGTTSNANIQYCWSHTLDASGNIVTVGFSENYTSGTLARFLGANGAVDTSFGTSGRVTPPLVNGATIQELSDATVDSDGRLVLAGYAPSGGALIVATRYLANGALDTSYGNAGVATAPAGGLEPRAVLQEDGRFVVIGAYRRGSNGSDLALWRFWP